jgi:hypothetical protein
MERVRDVVAAVSQTSIMRPQLEEEGVAIFDHAGTARFVDAHTLEADNGLRLQADKVIFCAQAARTGCYRCRVRSCSARTTTRGH